MRFIYPINYVMIQRILSKLVFLLKTLMRQ